MEVIGVIDYGMGNLHSLGKSLERVAGSQRVEISFDPEKLLKCDKLVLPGVGGVLGCMNELRRLELNDLIVEASQNKPMLGICLGMQVMLEHSDENGGVQALGLFPGEVIRFPDPEPISPGAKTRDRLKVPHMGWNRVRQTHSHPLWEGVANDSWFYFVHSYYARPKQAQHVIGVTEYMHSFACSLARDNLVAVQFHPEKSQAAGLRLLANFAEWDGQS